MRVFLITTTLEEYMDGIPKHDENQFVAIVGRSEWENVRIHFGTGIDMDMELDSIRETRAVVNYDSLTGTLYVPELSSSTDTVQRFAFALDERGIFIIDDSDYAESIIDRIRSNKRWPKGSLERFLYEFLEMMIMEDMSVLEKMEQELDQTERMVLDGELVDFPKRLAKMRDDLLDQRLYYDHLIDLGQELEENENGFFEEENLRYFRLFTERVQRLQSTVTSLRDMISQIRDQVHHELEVKQNRIVTWLTVVTSIFMPLTLITGWYGMNFRYMPELQWRFAYAGVFLLSLLIAVLLIVIFKKKKWF